MTETESRVIIFENDPKQCFPSKLPCNNVAMHLFRKKTRLIDTFGYFNQSELKKFLDKSTDTSSFKVVLEIGSYEGIFSCFAAEHFASEVHTVDPFFVDDEGTRMTNATENNFHRNLSNSTAISKIYSYKMTSIDFFIRNKSVFDFIYIDGSHESSIVKQDLNSSLGACRVGGIIWVDDFQSNYKDLHTTILYWSEKNSSALEVIHKGYQLGVRKK